MSGPEDPYVSLGARANAVSTDRNINERQTILYLIDGLPENALSTVADKTYLHTAKLSNKPDSPEYYGGLESVNWANKIQATYDSHNRDNGVIGAFAGGVVGVGGVSIYAKHNEDSIAIITQHDEAFDDFLLTAHKVGSLIAPVLAIGAFGAYVAKRCTASRLKKAAHVTAQQIEHPEDKVILNPRSLPAWLSKRILISASAMPTPAGNYLEKITWDIPPYATAKKWANAEGCNDSRYYADFLSAEMTPAELAEMVAQTQTLFADTLAASNTAKPSDPRYAQLLKDMRIVHAIRTRDSETRRNLDKVTRGIGYLGVMGCWGSVATMVESSNYDDFSYAKILLMVTLLSAQAAMMGFIAGGVAEKSGFITQLRSKRIAKKASNQASKLSNSDNAND